MKVQNGNAFSDTAVINSGFSKFKNRMMRHSENYENLFGVKPEKNKHMVKMSFSLSDKKDREGKHVGKVCNIAGPYKQGNRVSLCVTNG